MCITTYTYQVPVHHKYNTAVEHHFFVCVLLRLASWHAHWFPGVRNLLIRNSSSIRDSKVTSTRNVPVNTQLICARGLVYLLLSHHCLLLQTYDVYQYLLCRCIITDKISRTFLFLSVTLIQELVKHRSRADPVDARCSMNPPTKPMETTRWGSQHSSDSAANLPAHAFRLTPHA